LTGKNYGVIYIFFCSIPFFCLAPEADSRRGRRLLTRAVLYRSLAPEADSRRERRLLTRAVLYRSLAPEAMGSADIIRVPE
jgi:hypothetical protein